MCEPQDVDFDDLDADITVLAHQPGIGKTYAVMQYMKTQPDAFYFTDRHDTIDEIIADMGISDYHYSHWEGFGRKCEWNEGVDARRERGLPIGVLCELCNRSNCRYKQQFDERERVFAPYEYLKTKHIEPYPTIAFFDENKIAMDTLEFDRDAVVDWMRAIGESEHNIASMETGDFTSSTWYYIGEVAVSGHHQQAVRTAIENDASEKEIKHLLSNSAPNIWDYLWWARRYDDYDREYHVPLYYNAFDLVKEGVPLVFLDATFHRKFFHFLLEAYNGEIGFNRDVNVQIFTSKWQNKDTHVYRLRPRGYRPRRSFIYHRDSIDDWLVPDLQHLRQIFGDGNIGIIGHKEVVDDSLINGEYFGNLRSSNQFADKDALVILGTYAISEDVIHEYMAKLLYKPIDEIKKKICSREIAKKCDAHRIHQNSADGYLGNDEPIFMGEWLQQILFDNEMYQAYHRNRGLRHNRVVITYGLVFPRIKKEFTVKTISISDEEEFWQQLETKHTIGYVIRNLCAIVRDFEEGNSPTTIANEYKIWREGGGANVEAVQGLHAVYERLKRQGEN